MLVAALFCSLFVACAKSETQESEPQQSNSQQPEQPASQEDSNQPAENEQPEEQPAETYSPEDYVDLNMYFFDLRMVGADHGERVNKAINEYLGPKYGLQLNLTYFPVGDWISKVQMNIAAGEQVDLMTLCIMNGLNEMSQSHMLMDISDYMEENGKDALEMMKEYYPTYYREGKLLGIPTYRGYISNLYILMRRDILEELDMVEKAENLKTWSDYEEILEAVRANYTDETGLWPLGSRNCFPGGMYESDEIDSRIQWDELGNPNSFIFTDYDGNVSFLLDQPLYEEKLVMLRRWRDNGWIWPDSSLTDSSGDDLLKQNVTFSTFESGEYGIQSVKEDNCGHPLVCFQYSNGWVHTSALTGWGVGVPVTAEEPEEACRMINALYTDSTLMNLLIRGVEGEDYTVEGGEVVYTEDPHYYEADFVVGNNTLLVPLKGQGADYYEKIREINENAALSPYLGFIVDESELSDVIANMSAVYDQYFRDLHTGNYSPEMYAEYKSKLATAGVYEYIDAVQEQLTAWLATR